MKLFKRKKEREKKVQGGIREPRESLSSGELQVWCLCNQSLQSGGEKGRKWKKNE